jgi:hypothetical protein
MFVPSESATEFAGMRELVVQRHTGDDCEKVWMKSPVVRT